MLQAGKLTLSKPGSLWYGFSLSRLWIEMRTLARLCAGLHDGPVHVLLEIPHYITSDIVITERNVFEKKKYKNYSPQHLCILLLLTTHFQSQKYIMHN
jgi:hypothetical protein